MLVDGPGVIEYREYIVPQFYLKSAFYATRITEKFGSAKTYFKAGICRKNR